MWGSKRSVDLREHLVRRLTAEGAIRSPAVAEAFLAVPREQFLPRVPLEQVYQDEAIVVKRVHGEPRSSSSQPALMADMLEVLETRPGQRVLEIGAGTGYNAALLARLVGPSGLVVSVELDPEMAEQARANLARAGYGAVEVVCADGAQGYPACAPYDRVIVTVQQFDLAAAWMEQLAPDGVLVAPLTVEAGLRLSLIPAFHRLGELLVARRGSLGSFMPMRGMMAHPETPEPAALLTPGPTEEGLALLGGASRGRATLQSLARRGGLRPRVTERLPRPLSLQEHGGLGLLLSMSVGERAVRLRAGHARQSFTGQAFGLVGEHGAGASLFSADELLHYGSLETLDEARVLFERWLAMGAPRQCDFTLFAARAPSGVLPDCPGWTLERPNFRYLIGSPPPPATVTFL